MKMLLISKSAFVFPVTSYAIMERDSNQQVQVKGILVIISISNSIRFVSPVEKMYYSCGLHVL